MEPTSTLTEADSSLSCRHIGSYVFSYHSSFIRNAALEGWHCYNIQCMVYDGFPTVLNPSRNLQDPLPKKKKSYARLVE